MTITFLGSGVLLLKQIIHDCEFLNGLISDIADKLILALIFRFGRKV